jgi:hypothetical protein
MPGQSAVGAEQKSPDAVFDKPLTDYPQGDVSRWLPQVKTFRLRGEVRDETSPEKIAASLLRIKGQFPDLKDPDPNEFRELLPVEYTFVDYAFDRKRLRSLDESRNEKGRVLCHFFRTWDGKRTATHDEHPPSHQNYFVFDSKPDYGVQDIFTYSTYLSRQPPVFWWKDTAEATKNFQQSEGMPADYIRVGRETYHGVDCYVYLLCASPGNDRDRFYIGASDGRWYGAKEGIIKYPDLEKVKPQFVRAEEEFLGMKIGDRELTSAEAAQFRSLTPAKKAAWYRILYAHVAKDYVPCWEFWFADYRDVGNGHAFPFRESFYFHHFDAKTKKFSISMKRTFVVKEIAIDRPLDDSLFQEPLIEGAEVSDWSHQPPLIYKYKANIKPEEWQKILDEAAARDKDGKLHRQQIAKLIGKPGSALPTGEWINSKPLTWADLRGKIVVLKFWSIGCGPCYNDIDALSGHYGEIEDSRQVDAKSKLVPIVFIGVHAPGSKREEIEEVLKKRKLAAPICIDRAGKGMAAWGEFFASCAVDRMPTTIAVDEQGQIFAYGDFGQVMEKVWQHRGKQAEKK